MRRRDFQFELPPELVAQRPAVRRAGSRMLVLGPEGDPRDRDFFEFPRFLDDGDLLVLNDTRVIAARLLGRKETGGAVEVLVERLLGQERALCHVRASKSPRPGSWLRLEQDVDVQVAERRGRLFVLDFPRPVLAVLEERGRMPLPPYIEREAGTVDEERYQTVYAAHPGAVAAPTAGLHFDEAILETLRGRGVEIAYVTLHVGAGTFQPVRADDIREHRMHSEYVEVPEATVAAVDRTHGRGGRVAAVGTTVVRSLEAAAAAGRLEPFSGDTEIFIYPGYAFRVVDILLTNFHLPESTLIMLVAAFGGYERVMAAYRHAVEKRYRFFSYGDAMLVFKPHGMQQTDAF